ncbi:uncharacterized protein LOC144449762 [Glandiceps talaboti]
MDDFETRYFPDLFCSDCGRYSSCSWEKDIGKCEHIPDGPDDEGPNVVMMISLVVGGFVVLLIVVIVAWQVCNSRANPGLREQAQNETPVSGSPSTDYAVAYEQPPLVDFGDTGHNNTGFEHTSRIDMTSGD